jgi:hypothetical protein
MMAIDIDPSRRGEEGWWSGWCSVEMEVRGEPEKGWEGAAAVVGEGEK